MKFTFSDEVLAALAQSVQLGMLTGTDVVDHIRLLEVEPEPSDVPVAQRSNDNTETDGGKLILTPGCRLRHERNIADLLSRAVEISNQAKIPNNEGST